MRFENLKARMASSKAIALDRTTTGITVLSHLVCRFQMHGSGMSAEVFCCIQCRKNMYGLREDMGGMHHKLKPEWQKMAFGEFCSGLTRRYIL